MIQLVFFLSEPEISSKEIKKIQFLKNMAGNNKFGGKSQILVKEYYSKFEEERGIN